MVKPPDVCPNCGADVPANARACPHCGSDENTGWSDHADEGSLDLPDDFDYGEFVKREFGSGRVRPYGMKLFWWCAAVLVSAVFIFLVLHFLY